MEKHDYIGVAKFGIVTNQLAGLAVHRRGEGGAGENRYAAKHCFVRTRLPRRTSIRHPRPRSCPYYLLGDHLGSTALTTDSNGARQAELRYYPYGKTRYTSPANTPTSFRFTGQRWQANSNDLYFYQSRWYDPLVGRFLSADTIVPDPQDPQGLNRYSYVENNPVKFTDPTGHCAFDSNGNIIKTDCTVEDFLRLDWNKRSYWLKKFVETHMKGRLDGWFNDIAGAIGYLGSDKNFSKESGWAYYMDAGVLQAVNNGMRLYEGQPQIGGGGEGWSDFFQALDKWDGGKGDSLNQLIKTRLVAEQQDVDYAGGLPESQRRKADSQRIDQIHIEVFLWGANGYRSIAPAMRESLAINVPVVRDATDPRSSWGTLQMLGKLARPTAWFLYGQLMGPQVPEQ